MFDTIHCNDCEDKPEMIMSRLSETDMYVFRCPKCNQSVFYDDCENFIR